MSDQRTAPPALFVITPPAAELLPLASARAHLYVDTTDQDERIADAVKAAREWVEDESGLLIGSRTLELRLPAWPSDGEIVLPGVPATSVTSVKYLDPAGVEQTWDAAKYVVSALNARVACARVRPAYGQPFPALREHPEAVRVRYVAGAATLALVPQKAIQALLLIAGDLFEHREQTITGTIATTIETCQALIWGCRVERAA